MTMTDRGIHPDLLEEEAAAASPPAPEPSPPPAAAPATQRRNGRSASANGSAPTPALAEPTSPIESSPPPASETESDRQGERSPSENPPDWLQQVREAADPQAMLAALLKNVPIDELEKHPQIAGWVGDMGNRRARAMLADQERQRAEREKSEAVARGDYYRLGELTAPELQQQVSQQQAAEAMTPFMDGVSRFQQSLPAEVQQQVQGRNYGVGKSYSDGVAEYLGATVEAAVSHRLTAAVEAEIKRREPALRKALLSETVGAEQTPERDGGSPIGVREITDEQIDRMSLEEYEQYFDDNGRPRNGVRYRSTRGVPIDRR